jgi:agmatine deiminase
MSATITSTPAGDGYRMPGEFEAHAGCWMAWPERPDNWRLGAKPAQRAYAAVAEAINVCDPVTMAVSDAQFEHCRSLLSPSIRVVEIATDDAWIRDMGPTFLIDDNGGRRGVDWHFNAWGGLDGGLYFPWDRDERVARKVLEIEGADRYRAPIVLEGGSIHVDGEGTVMATEECLLNRNRNPELSREQIERVLFEHLGTEKMIWLGQGVYNDETDGHVDNLACFARPGVVLLTWTDDESDPQHAISRDAQEPGGSEGCAGPLDRGGAPALSGPDHDQRGGGGRRRRRSGKPATAPRGSLGSLLRQLLPGHEPDRAPASGRALRRASRRRAPQLLSRSRGGGGARARDPARRWQHPLHHPAGPCGGGRGQLTAGALSGW